MKQNFFGEIKLLFNFNFIVIELAMFYGVWRKHDHKIACIKLKFAQRL